MTINEFLTSCGVNAPKLAEYIKQKYFAEDETPRRKEWSTRSVHMAKMFDNLATVLIKDAWWDRGTGIGRSNFVLVVDESTGQVYRSSSVDYRDQYSERKDRPWCDFHEIKSVAQKEGGSLMAEVADWNGHSQRISLKGGE
jgi:hypothetical protein